MNAKPNPATQVTVSISRSASQLLEWLAMYVVQSVVRFYPIVTR